MRAIIDGYNVTKQDPATCDLPLEEQREALITRLATRGRDLLGAGPIVVVFDGQLGIGPDTRRGPVEVRYSRGEKADPFIVRLVSAAPHCTVVTSDSGLAGHVRDLGATVIGRERVFESCRPPRRKRRSFVAEDGLPRGHKSITRELEDLWLTDEE